MNKRLFLLWLVSSAACAQIPLDASKYQKNSSTKVTQQGNDIVLSWPTTGRETGRLVVNLEAGKPLFRHIQLAKGGRFSEIATDVDPAFVLTVGKRDLISQNGWNIFFDKTNKRPSKAYAVELTKRQASVSTVGTRTVLRIGDVQAASFRGAIEITVYQGSPLFNVAAVMATEIDSTAILYDAGLVGKQPGWNTLSWSDTTNQMQRIPADVTVPNRAQAVKYRTIIGSNAAGSLALFPAPHQYFYPLDEAFNLDFTWYGTGYRSLIPDFGIGIRQDLMGDRRWVPWVNAPPGTQQRLNFFCLLSTESPDRALEAVKQLPTAIRLSRWRVTKPCRVTFTMSS